MRFEHLTAGTMGDVLDEPLPIPANTNPNSRSRMASRAMPECYAEASIRSSSVSEPDLSSG